MPVQQGIERCLQEKWYGLVMAEQQGASQQILEQLCDAYLLMAEQFHEPDLVEKESKWAQRDLPRDKDGNEGAKGAKQDGFPAF